MRDMFVCILCGLLAGVCVQSAFAQEFEPEAGFQPIKELSKQVDAAETKFTNVNSSKKNVEKNADKKNAESFGYDDESFRENLEPRMSATRQMILMRAVHRARQRVARIEQNKWHGYSAQRPNTIGVQGGITGSNSYYNPYYYSHSYFAPHRIGRRIGRRYIDGPWLTGYYTR